MDNHERANLKKFLLEVKIPKIFYSENLIDFIDIHMILLSQIDAILHGRLLDEQYINIISEEDDQRYHEMAKTDNDVMTYYTRLKSVIQILKKYRLNKNS